MFFVQNRLYCGVCNKSFIAKSYPNRLKSQGHSNKDLKDHCTNSTMVKTHFIKKYLKTELVNIITSEAVYQLQYYKKIYICHIKRMIKLY